MRDKWFTLWLNPEPWAVGSVSGNRISPNPNLVAFQSAVREALEGTPKLPPDMRSLEFYFWRQQAKYIDAADRVRQRNAADATNMQKGLEDALQGILFDNDREIRDIRSAIVDQGPHVKHPMILIHAYETDIDWILNPIPTDVLEKALNGLPTQSSTDSKWSQAEDLF